MWEPPPWGTHLYRGCDRHMCSHSVLPGAGLATVVISFLFCSYYNVVIAWALYYMFASFQTEIPWASCNNTWNTATCHDTSAGSGNGSVAKNVTTPSEDYF